MDYTAEYFKSRVGTATNHYAFVYRIIFHKTKNRGSVLTYSSRIEKLQNLIIEQETSGKALEVAKAFQASFKQ